MNSFINHDFIFNPRYRVWRHITYWSFHIAIWAAFWIVIGAPGSYGRYLFNMILWVPAFVFFSYPLVYLAVPHLLLKRKILQFFLVTITWAAFGLYIDIAYRNYILIPIQESMGLNNIIRRGPLPFCYLCMTTSAASPMIIKFFKLWTVKQRQWIKVQEEKAMAELQLLKAQIHPHFLFNTLNNIYLFALENSPKTPGLILKLSSLLSYMLYDCKADAVRLEKEIANMKNYVDLEKERHGNKIEVSWSVEGDLRDKMIAPLLFLSFLTHAFKHSFSSVIGKPWVGVDISLQKGMLSFKVVNSKSNSISVSDFENDINNIQKRLQLLYPARHELKINNEEDFFVVQLHVELYADSPFYYTPKIREEVTQRLADLQTINIGKPAKI